MPELVFFDPRPRRCFADFLRACDVPVEELQGEDSYGVGIPEDTDDNLRDEIEACYAEMMAFNQELFEGDLDAGEAQAAGVVVNLASGDTAYARADPGLLGRIMQVLTRQELDQVVNAIGDAIENSDGRPLCHRPDGMD
jgi:hypothetical protein